MPEPTRTINPEHAAELYEDGVICEETNPTAGPWTYIATQNLGSRRWNSDHRMILRHADGTHWGISYVLGLTEEQPHELPWSCADTPLPLTQVWPHQITHTVYFAYDHLPRRPPMPTDPALPEHPDYIDPSSDDLPAPHRAERRIRAYLTASVLDGILDAADPGDGHPRPLYRRDLHALINNSREMSDALQLCETQLAAAHAATRRAVVTAHDTQQLLDKAIAALSEYFQGAAIGPDIAPRITEMRSDLMARAHAAERARDNAYAEREQLRYERRLLGAARLILDLVAAGDHSRWPQARREAQDLAQRLVDEIGHPVTDEDALGPTYREQLAHAEAARDRAHFELNRVYTAGLYIADCLERHADSSGSAAVSGFAADLRAVLTGARQQGSASPDGSPAVAAGHGRNAASAGGIVATAERLSEWVCTGDYDWTSSTGSGWAALGNPPDWVRFRDGGGRHREGPRSPACPGDDHRHDIRCIADPSCCAVIPPRRAGEHGCA